MTVLDAFRLTLLIDQHGDIHGWGAYDRVRAVCIALAESGGRSDAWNNDGGSDAVGLWQISRRWHPEFGSWDLWDPATNLKAAFHVWSAGNRTWCPWDTYTSKAYRRHMFDARMAFQLYYKFPVNEPPHHACLRVPGRPERWQGQDGLDQAPPVPGQGVDQGDLYGLNAWKAAEAEWLNRQGEAVVEGFVKHELYDLFDAVHVALREDLGNLNSHTQQFRGV